MKKAIVIFMLGLLLVGCSNKEPEKSKTFKYPKGQKYKDISNQKGFDMPYEYHQ